MNETLKRKVDNARREYVKLSGEYIACKDEEKRLVYLETRYLNGWNRSADFLHNELMPVINDLMVALETGLRHHRNLLHVEPKYFTDAIAKAREVVGQ